MSGDTTIVYAVNDFPAIAKALKQLNGAPTHHGTALATIPPPPTMHELVKEAAEDELRRRLLEDQQLLIEANLRKRQKQLQHLQLHAMQTAMNAQAQGQQAYRQHYDHQQCLNQAYGQQQQLIDPGHSHSIADVDAQHSHSHDYGFQELLDAT